MEMLSTINLQQAAAPTPSEGQAENAQSQDGAFAQLLLALFGGNLNGEGAGIPAGSLADGAAPGEQPSEEEKPPGDSRDALYALQMAALGILSPEPAAAPLVLLSEETAAAGMAIPGSPAQGQAETRLPVGWQLQSTGNDAVPKGPSFEVLGYEETDLQAEAAPARDPISSLAGAEEFRKAVSEVKKALAAEPDKAQVLPPDVEALQQKAGHTDLGALSASQEKLPVKQNDLAEQVKTQVFQSRADGKDEFVVKLKPESLGEITVKMREQDGKITLSIVTASTQTAKLLNEAADALRMSLRPLQAEIREIIPRPEEPAQSQQGGWTGGGFESFQQQYAGRQAHTPQGRPQFTAFPETDSDGAEAAILAGAGLNTYI